MLTLGAVCREVERPSYHVDGDYTEVIDQQLLSIRELAASLNPAEAAEHAAEVFACLKPLWNSESTLRIYKCLELFNYKSFDLYRPHLKTHAPYLKASIMGFLGDTRGCHKYQLTCFEVYRELYLEGSKKSECRSFSSNYANKLKEALQSNRLVVTYDWLKFLRYQLFRQTVLPAVIEAIPDFRNWLNIVQEDTFNLNLSGHKGRPQLRQNLSGGEWYSYKSAVDIRLLCQEILAFIPPSVPGRYYYPCFPAACVKQ